MTDTGSTDGLDGVDEDDLDDFTPWTAEGARRLLARADELATAVREHAEAISRLSGDAEVAALFAASDRLLPAVLAYADAQFDYTGSGFPFGIVREVAEADDEDDVVEDLDDGEPLTGVSVLQRRDYAVPDEAAVIAEGRAAHRRMHTDAGPGSEDAHVTTVGNALYAIAHVDGWDALDDVEALEPTGGAVVVVRNGDLLHGDPDEWPEELFDVDGDTLFEQDDVFGY